MKQNHTLNVEPRNIFGRKTNALRRQGLVPAVMYGRGFETVHLQVPLKSFEKVYAEAGESTVVEIALADQKYPAIIKEVALDPVKDHVLHIDLYRVHLDEAIVAAVPLEFIGEAPAVADFNGVLVKNISEIEVEGLPNDLPSEIVVDLSSLTEMGGQILLKDLTIPSTLKIEADPETVIASIQEQEKEEVIEVAPSIEDVEVIGAKPEGEEGEGSDKAEESKDEEVAEKE